MYLLSLDKPDFVDDESSNDGSDSGSSVTYYFCAFSLYFYNSVGSFRVLGSGVFAPTVVKSKYDFFRLTCSHQQESSPKVVDSSKCFGAQIPCFISKFETQFYSYNCSQNLPHSLQQL